MGTKVRAAREGTALPGRVNPVPCAQQKTCLKGSSREADIDNRLVGTAGEGKGGMDRENGIEIQTLPCVSRELMGSG